MVKKITEVKDEWDELIFFLAESRKTDRWQDVFETKDDYRYYLKRIVMKTES
jgi:hypothetical protein